MGASIARADDYQGLKKTIDADLKSGTRNQFEFDRKYNKLVRTGATPHEIYESLTKSGFTHDQVIEYFRARSVPGVTRN